MTPLLPTTPEVIQRGILFVAKTCRGEKKDGANYLKHSSGLERSPHFNGNL